jgi:hypothetical protein
LLIWSRRYVPDHLYLIKYLIQLLKLAVPQTVRTSIEVLLSGHVPQPFVLEQTRVRGAFLSCALEPGLRATKRYNYLAFVTSRCRVASIDGVGRVNDIEGKGLRFVKPVELLERGPCRGGKGQQGLQLLGCKD